MRDVIIGFLLVLLSGCNTLAVRGNTDDEATVGVDAGFVIRESRTDAGEVEIRGGSEWCYSIDEEVLGYFPGAGETLIQAGLVWDLEIATGDNCPWSLSMADFPGSPDTMGRYFRGDIFISRYWAGSGDMLDITQDECLERGEIVLLRDVLAHEFGHAVGIREHTATGIMADRIEYCAWYDSQL